MVRVNITSGEDIAHLGELDQKLWTVLSCPTKDLAIDERIQAPLLPYMWYTSQKSIEDHKAELEQVKRDQEYFGEFNR